MGWVEELKPEDEVKVEIIYPEEYVKYNLSTINKISAGISHLCKGAALLGEKYTEILAWDITILQAQIIENTMKVFGIEMTHESGITDGRRWVYFFADVSKLFDTLEELEEKSVEDLEGENDEYTGNDSEDFM